MFVSFLLNLNFGKVVQKRKQLGVFFGNLTIFVFCSHSAPESGKKKEYKNKDNKSKADTNYGPQYCVISE